MRQPDLRIRLVNYPIPNRPRRGSGVRTEVQLRFRGIAWAGIAGKLRREKAAELIATLGRIAARGQVGLVCTSARDLATECISDRRWVRGSVCQRPLLWGVRPDLPGYGRHSLCRGTPPLRISRCTEPMRMPSGIGASRLCPRNRRIELGDPEPSRGLAHPFVASVEHQIRKGFREWTASKLCLTRTQPLLCRATDERTRGRSPHWGSVRRSSDPSASTARVLSGYARFCAAPATVSRWSSCVSDPRDHGTPERNVSRKAGLPPVKP